MGSKQLKRFGAGRCWRRPDSGWRVWSDVWRCQGRDPDAGLFTDSAGVRRLLRCEVPVEHFRAYADAARAAERGASVLFDPGVARLPAAEILAVAGDVPSAEVPAVRLTGGGLPLVELLAATGVASSRGEAMRLIRGGGIYLNNERITDERLRLTLERTIEGRLILLRKGQKQNLLVRVVSG